MRVLKPRTTALYNAACAECKASGELTPEHYAWLYDASLRATDCGHECPSLLEVPVIVGNVTLHPRTLGASIWWAEYGAKWYGSENGSADEIVAMAWMLAHSKTPEVFQRLTTRWRASAAIMAWQIRVAASVTVNELSWGIVRLFGQRNYVDVSLPGAPMQKKEVESASAADWGSVIARLCATYYRPPEYFLWQIGENAALDMLKNAPMPDGSRREAQSSGREFTEFRAVVDHIKADLKAAKG